MPSKEQKKINKREENEINRETRTIKNNGRKSLGRRNR